MQIKWGHCTTSIYFDHHHFFMEYLSFFSFSCFLDFPRYINTSLVRKLDYDGRVINLSGIMPKKVVIYF